ncbi:MAG: TfoX/Sxy family protein [Gammaproteobacteria bacterium]|nr:TfoX/Sxy family protein [Gammaproteobacteria bacterium]
MSEAQEFATHIVDLLDVYAPCEARRMFGGFDIFHQGMMFGLIAGGSLYPKADTESRDLFIAEGSEAFSYHKKDKEYRLSYYLAPETFFEDPGACQHWARLAFDAASRNPNKSKKSRQKSS